MLRRLSALVLVLFLAALAAADVVHLKDGRRIEGKVVAETASVVRIETRFGTLEFDRADVERIEKGKTKQEEFRERERAAKSAADFFALGEWAAEAKLRREAKRCMERAVELDPEHEGAHRWLGHVRYRGEWMTPEERDRRQAADSEAEMRAKGLVQHEGRWVTPHEKAQLEQGLVLHEGRWMSFEEAQAAMGLALWRGEWVRAAEVTARQSVAAAGKAADFVWRVHLTDQAIVAGDLADAELAEIGAGLERARAAFDAAWAVEPGLGLFGGRLAEIYVVRDRDDVYQRTCPHFASLTDTVPAGWAEAVERIHGFMWFDPYPVSSVRRWKRADVDMNGHCYFNFGHLLVNRLGYDDEAGTLLPPWYEEGVSCWVEHAAHGRNTTFSRVREGTSSGTSARAATFDVDPKVLRAGDFDAIVKGALEAGRVPGFDRLAQLGWHELEPIDVAVATTIVRWLAEQGGLAAFHAALRADAPPLPERVFTDARRRQARYDAAFRAAVGAQSSREADQAWRAWARER